MGCWAISQMSKKGVEISTIISRNQDCPPAIRAIDCRLRQAAARIMVSKESFFTANKGSTKKVARSQKVIAAQRAKIMNVLTNGLAE